MIPQWIIEKKRDGHALGEAEIRGFITGYTNGEIPDYQMSALAMAIFFKGMTFDEIAVLTDAMMRSGDVVDTSSVPWPKADKHSTGGVGDKISLILAPLVACCDVAVPMISGRGLGITGGTLDKLESIPGFRTRLPVDEFLHVLRQCGCAMIGQTDRLAPADRKLYALRDVTATVPSIPLIAASIMCKKMAEGIDALVLDVKWGSGAFMKTQAQAAELARTMVEIGRRMGKKVAAVLTNMNQPLGRAAGNAVEVVESMDVLRGKGPADVADLTVELGAHMLALTGRCGSIMEAQALLRQKLQSGVAFEKFREMTRLQGGDVKALDQVDRLPRARIQEPVLASMDGYIVRVDADAVGRTCVALNAGRRKTDDAVDPAVGVTDLVKEGEKVHKGQPLAVIHANDDGRLAEARPLLGDAFKIGAGPLLPQPLIGEIIQ
jgi:pyrimidine-nucleoside phosphorylase